MKFNELQQEIKDDLFADNLHRILFATDVFSYKELPVAVTRLRDKEDARFYSSDFRLPTSA